MSAVSSIELEYQLDSSALFTLLAQQPYPVFLDSSGYGGRVGRYDILSAAPVRHLSITQTMQASGYFSVMRALQAEFMQPSLPTQVLPFSGGLIGYLGYPTQVGKDQLQLDDGFIGMYLWAVVIDHIDRTSHLVFHPACDAKTREFAQSLVTQSCTGIESQTFTLTDEFTPTQSAAEYATGFERIKKYITAGDCYQVNLTQEFVARCQGNPVTAYNMLRSANQAPFSAYIGQENSALLCLSPERFVQSADNTVLTQPIKGTRPRAADPTRDQILRDELLNSEKDRAENLMIVDLLRNDLGRVCETGSIRVEKLFELLSFRGVHHLISTITGKLDARCDPIDLLMNCFPGGSITGAPKLRAMEIIQELESHQRRIYCGSVYYLSADGRFDSNITIRSLLWQPDELRCWAGGGIVMDSDCDAEYRECRDKIRPIVNALQTRQWSQG